MKHPWTFSVLAVLTTSCLDEGTFGKFDQAEVIAFGIAGETASALVFAADRRIQVTLAANADREHSIISTLEVSSLAAPVQRVGDAIDLTENYKLVITAEDGTQVPWTIDPGPAPDPGGGSAGMGGGESGSCPSSVATYRLTGLFQITDTPLAAGDGEFSVGPGTLKLRVVPSGLGTAVVTLLEYDMPQNFVLQAPGALTTTDTHASAGPDECGLALGSLSGNVLNWQSCDYGPAPPLGTTSWGAEDVIGGPGCLNDYRVVGTITCAGLGCNAAGVSFPIEVNDLYPQPLNAFEFSDDFSTFRMRSLGAPPTGAGRSGVELPNTEPSRSWIGLDGTLVESTCEEPPPCN